VPPGEYDFFPALGNADSPVYPVQIAVSVADRDVENVDLPLDPQIEISGRLTLDGAGPGERLKDSIALVRLDGLPGKTTATVISPKPETGDFEIKDFSVGRYAIRLDPDVRSAGIYVSDMTYGGASVPDSELIVKEPASALKIELKSDGGTVAGTVLDVTRLRPYPYATVALLPESGRRRDYTLYRDATAEPDGRFSFTGVPPGNYVLFAWQTVTRGAWQNPIFLGRYENRGTPVVVEAAVTRTLQIVAIP
jgi:hypothetical protein